MPKYTLFIDGDILVYRAAFACQKDGELLPYNTAELVLRNDIRNQIKYLSQRFSTIKKIVICLTSDDKSNFRFNLATFAPYKGNRASDKPVYYKALRQYLITKWQSPIAHGKEADDYIATQVHLLPNEAIISSADKDLRQIKADSWHWEMNYGEAPYFVAQESLGSLYLKKSNSGLTQAWGTGTRWFYYQLLVGDKTCDNIQGLHRWGPALGVPFLSDCYDEEMLCAFVWAAYVKMQIPYKHFLENGRLLWLQTKENELWEPPLRERHLWELEKQLLRLKILDKKILKKHLKPLLLTNWPKLRTSFGV